MILLLNKWFHAGLFVRIGRSGSVTRFPAIFSVDDYDLKSSEKPEKPFEDNGKLYRCSPYRSRVIVYFLTSLSCCEVSNGKTICLQLLSLSLMTDFERDQMASHRFSASMEYPLAPKQVRARASFDHFTIALAARRNQSPPLSHFVRLLSVLMRHSRHQLVPASGSLSDTSLATVHVLNSQRFHRSRLTPPASVRCRVRS